MLLRGVNLEQAPVSGIEHLLPNANLSLMIQFGSIHIVRVMIYSEVVILDYYLLFLGGNPFLDYYYIYSFTI